MQETPCGIVVFSLLGLITLVRGAWVNFDTWEDRKSYDQFSHYETLDYNYRNPYFTNSPHYFETLPPTTPSTPRFFKRNLFKLGRFINETWYKHNGPARFDKFDKYRVLRKIGRQMQKLVYLNAPEERFEWFHDPDSSGHVDACTISNEVPYKGWGAWWRGDRTDSDDH